MGAQFEFLTGEVAALWASLLVQVRLMLLPSRLMQAAILVGCLIAAWLIRRWLQAPVYDWRYKTPDESDVRLTTTGDFTNQYVGVLAEDAPWAMHHGKRIFDPASAFGHAVLAIQALHAEIAALKGAQG